MDENNYPRFLAYLPSSMRQTIISGACDMAQLFMVIFAICLSVQTFYSSGGDWGTVFIVLSAVSLLGSIYCCFREIGLMYPGGLRAAILAGWRALGGNRWLQMHGGGQTPFSSWIWLTTMLICSAISSCFVTYSLITGCYKAISDSSAELFASSYIGITLIYFYLHARFLMIGSEDPTMLPTRFELLIWSGLTTMTIWVSSHSINLYSSSPSLLVVDTGAFHLLLMITGRFLQPDAGASSESHISSKWIPYHALFLNFIFRTSMLSESPAELFAAVILYGLANVLALWDISQAWTTANTSTNFAMQRISYEVNYISADRNTLLTMIITRWGKVQAAITISFLTYMFFLPIYKSGGDPGAVLIAVSALSFLVACYLWFNEICRLYPGDPPAMFHVMRKVMHDDFLSWRMPSESKIQWMLLLIAVCSCSFQTYSTVTGIYRALCDCSSELFAACYFAITVIYCHHHVLFLMVGNQAPTTITVKALLELEIWSAVTALVTWVSCHSINLYSADPELAVFDAVALHLLLIISRRCLLSELGFSGSVVGYISGKWFPYHALFVNFVIRSATLPASPAELVVGVVLYGLANVVACWDIRQAGTTDNTCNNLAMQRASAYR